MRSEKDPEQPGPVGQPVPVGRTGLEVRLLLRLYPRTWRERYGREFLALIDTDRVSPKNAIDIARQAAAEWRRVSGVDVWLLPLLISGSGLVMGRALAARAPAPAAAHTFDVIASLSWSAVLVWRAGWVVRARMQRHANVTTLPALSTAAARAGLVAAFVVGVNHFWIGHVIVLWLPFTVIGNPAFMMAMFVGLARYGHSLIWQGASRPRPPHHPLGIG